MSVVLQRQKEAAATYPTVPNTPTGVDADAVWQRIEQWVSYRWPQREVEWIVTGSGEFIPPLAECEFTKLERSDGAGWLSAGDPLYTPLGVVLSGGGYYRVTANVGSNDDPPAAVIEAFKRLAEYLVASTEHAGLSRHSMSLGDLSESRSLSPAASARAIHYSGAADLLRPWRCA